MTRAAIYRRISSDPEGLEAGVDRQETECRALAQRRGWEVAETFTDNDVSATSGKRRPAFEAMKDAIRAGRIDAVVVWHQDRLWRMMGKDTLDMMELAKERSLPIACVASPDIDLTTPDGEMVATILTSVATAEVRRAGIRQKARWAQRRADGKNVTLGKVPFGFVRVGPEGDRQNEVDPVQARVIKDGAARIIGGDTLYAVCVDWRDRGIVTSFGNVWRPQHARRMFTNRLLVDKGILTEDEHELLVARLEVQPKATVGGKHQQGRRYALTGFTYCGECGAKLEAGGGAQRATYRCTINMKGCGHIGVKATLLEQYVIEQCVLQSAEGQPPAEEATEDVAPLLKKLRGLEMQMAELSENVELPLDMVVRRTRALEAKRIELKQRLAAAAPVGGGPRLDFTGLDPERWSRRELTEAETVALHDFVSHFASRVTIGPRVLGLGRAFNPERVTITWRHPEPEPVGVSNEPWTLADEEADA